MSSELTRRDVDALIKVVNQRARLAGQQIDAAKAARIAQFEADALQVWDTRMLGISEAVAAANAEVEKIRQQMNARLDELDLPEHSRPRLASVGIYAQQSADRYFRSDLRRQITTEVDAAAKAAKIQIETEKLRVTEQLLVNALDSAEARSLIESLPTAEALMPSLEVTVLVDRALKAGDRR
jgi:hypothetical protein